MKSSSISHKLKTRIANLSPKERAVFVCSCILIVVGIFGALVTLSNRHTTAVPLFGGTYREGIIGSPRFINPVLANSESDQDLTALVYSGLLRESADGSLMPDLASSYAVSPDGKTYTVILKSNLTFQDGSPLTSADVLFTVEKIQDPTLSSPLEVAWNGIAVTTPDVHTVVFTLQKPYAGFLQQLTLGILPQHIWSSISDENWEVSRYNTEPVGSGPYRVVSVARSDTGVPTQITLRAFSHFALGRPLIKNVKIKIYANTLDEYGAKEANDVDAISMVDSGDVSSVKGRHDAIITDPLPRVFALFLNPAQNSLFSDPTVVHALNLATDKQALISQIFKGYGTPLDGPLPDSIDTPTGTFASNQLLAEAMLDKDGWKVDPTTGFREKTTTTGKGKSSSSSSQQLAFTISTSNTPDLEESAQLLADQYKEIGVQVTVKIFEIGTLNQDVIQNRDFDALLFGQVIKNDTDIFAFWDSSQRAAPGLNITGYDNKQVDTLLEQATQEPDPTKRAALYQQVTAQLAKDAPVVFLYTPDTIELMNNRIKNVIIPPITTPSDRFSLIYQWYIDTDRVWNIFLTH